MNVALDGVGIAQINTFVLVLTRIGALMVFAPMFAGRTIPTRVKAVFAVVVAFAIMPIAGADASGLARVSAAELLLLIGKEVIVGLIIGFAVGAVVVAWQMAASLLDLTIGFAYGGLLDPVTGNQTPVLQQLYGLTAVAMFLAVGGEQWVIGALAKSYEMVPVTGAAPVMDVSRIAANVMTATFEIGVGVAAPVLVALLLTDVAFGLVARAAPQAQIMTFEFPVKIAVGIIVIIACLPFMGSVFTSSLQQLTGLTIGG